MYGEPSVYEYGKMINEANKSISTDGFKCIHNNVGWLGYYITTPKGKKYQLVKQRSFTNEMYYLCEYTPISFQTGKPLDLEFKSLEECKEYLKEMEF